MTPQSIHGESLDVPSTQIFDYFKVKEDTFAVFLIGKDGGIKMRKEKVVPMEEIFRLIDSMPMRQAEMRRKH